MHYTSFHLKAFVCELPFTYNTLYLSLLVINENDDDENS